MTRVKICGLATPGDAVAAYEAGADYLGLIFAASPRRVDRSTAQAIRAAVPDAALVGVFLDQPLAEIEEITAMCRLEMVQLHGGEDSAVVRAVQARTGRPVLKVVHEGAPLCQAADYLLFDLPKGRHAAPGARSRLWDAAGAAVFDGRAVFLAGALGPDDVETALTRVRPYGLDVASGVERVPARKDPVLMKRFVEEVRRVRV